MVKRRYDGTARALAARRTRQAILAAAADLFVEPGYAATRLADVAAAAGVAVPTVIAHFGSKKGLLSALVDVSVAGDDDPIPMAEREFVAELEAMADARDKLRRYAVHLSAVHARLVGIQLALQTAATADAEAATILRKNDEERRSGMRLFARNLRTTGQVRSELSEEQVVDVLWLAMDITNYDVLVRRRGWTPEEFQRWYVDSVAGAILVHGPGQG